MSLGRRFWTGISAALVILVLVAAPASPAFASGEDKQSADASKKSEKSAPAKADDAAECKPKAKFNTFEDFFSTRDWLLRAPATPSSEKTTIVWREPVTAKPGPTESAAKPAAKATSKKN